MIRANGLGGRTAVGSAGQDAVDGAAVAPSDVGFSDGNGEEVDEPPTGHLVSPGDHWRQPVSECAKRPDARTERVPESWRLPKRLP